MTDTCPICSREMEDTRHVGVECLYDVSEVAPSARKETILREIIKDAAY